MAPIAALAVALALSLAAAQLPPLPSYPGLALRYEDDFDGAALNSNVFTAVDGFVQTPYAQVCYRSDDVAVRDGLLVLTTRARAAECVFHATGERRAFEFTSGWVDTVRTQTLTQPNPSAANPNPARAPLHRPLRSTASSPSRTGSSRSRRASRRPSSACGPLRGSSTRPTTATARRARRCAGRARSSSTCTR